MSVSRTRSVKLEGELSIRDGERISLELSRALKPKTCAVVDCSGVAACDVGVLQLLVAAQKSAKRLGKTLKIRAPAGGAVDHALTRSGFASADLALQRDGEFWTGLSAENGSSET